MRNHQHGESSFVFAVCMVLFVFVFFSGADQMRPGLEEQAVKRPAVSEMVRSLFSVTKSASTTSTSFWYKLKTLIYQSQAYFFPQNLDFRGSDEATDEAKGSSSVENVKEAAARTLEKSKETVEDSARSAAEIAGKTMHKTKQKVEETLSRTEL